MKTLLCLVPMGLVLFLWNIGLVLYREVSRLGIMKYAVWFWSGSWKIGSWKMLLKKWNIRNAQIHEKSAHETAHKICCLVLKRLSGVVSNSQECLKQQVRQLTMNIYHPCDASFQKISTHAKGRLSPVYFHRYDLKLIPGKIGEQTKCIILLKYLGFWLCYHAFVTLKS